MTGLGSAVQGDMPPAPLNRPTPLPLTGGVGAAVNTPSLSAHCQSLADIREAAVVVTERVRACQDHAPAPTLEGNAFTVACMKCGKDKPAVSS